MNDKEESHSNWPKQTIVTSTGDVLGHSVAHNSGFMTFGSANVVSTSSNTISGVYNQVHVDVEKRVQTLNVVAKFLSLEELDMVIQYTKDMIASRDDKSKEKKKVSKRKLNL